MPEIFRRPNRLPPPCYLGLHSYLVTICTQDRKKLFTTTDVVNPLVCLLAEQAQGHFFDVYAYCFMPNHCHIILNGLNPSADLSATVRAFKGHAAALMRRSGIRDVWQKGFHDHIIRDGEDLRAAAAYVLENPVRAGFVKNIYDWPFSGSFVFAWRKFSVPDRKFTPAWKSL